MENNFSRLLEAKKRRKKKSPAAIVKENKKLAKEVLRGVKKLQKGSDKLGINNIAFGVMISSLDKLINELEVELNDDFSAGLLDYIGKDKKETDNSGMDHQKVIKTLKYKGVKITSIQKDDKWKIMFTRKGEKALVEIDTVKQEVTDVYDYAWTSSYRDEKGLRDILEKTASELFDN